MSDRCVWMRHRLAAIALYHAGLLLGLRVGFKLGLVEGKRDEWKVWRRALLDCGIHGVVGKETPDAADWPTRTMIDVCRRLSRTAHV